MTKAELVTEISAKTGQDELLVLQAVEAMMKVIRESLVKGENVYLRGFGSFIIKKRAKKVGRNITKNTFVVIPEHFVPAFKPVKTFVTRVKNRKPAEDNGSSHNWGGTKLVSTGNGTHGPVVNNARSTGKVVNLKRTPLADRSWDQIRGLGKTGTHC